MPLKDVMVPQQSLTTILTTKLGVSLGGFWQAFRTPRKKLPSKRTPAQQPVSSTSAKEEIQPLSCWTAPTTLHCTEKGTEAIGCQTATVQLSPSISLPSPERLLGVKPVVVSSEEQWDRVWPSLRQELSVFPVLGIDCEWVSANADTPAVSLLQIASYSGLCVLVRLVSFRGSRQPFPHGLLEVLRDPRILKVGVGCYDDGKRLAREDCGPLSLRGAVDLRHLALRGGGRVTFNCDGLSLQSLAADVLNVSLDKSPKLRCSDWEAEQLTAEQITYAARDAQVSVAIFFHLLSLYPGAGSPNAAGCTYSQLAVRCQGLIDVPFRHRIVLDGEEEKISDGERKRRLGKPPCDDGPGSGVVQVPDPRKNNRKPSPFYARKRPMYDNCFLHAPDDQLLSRCDKRRAMWYISIGRGELRSEDPFTVRLLFEPSGRADSYYRTTMDNVCVVCGKADPMYIRKCIVPNEYRRHFPQEMKKHGDHDVLMLCIICHAASCTHDEALKRQLVEECGVKGDVHRTKGSYLWRVHLAARALLSAGDGLPEKRRAELEAVVRGFYHGNAETKEEVRNDMPLSPQALREACGLYYQAYEPLGLKVVRAHAAKGPQGLVELQRRWRRHFLAHMKPRHLPPLWSVDYTAKREGFIPKHFVKRVNSTNCFEARSEDTGS